MQDLTVGQIGLGNMGGNVAKHLVDEGFDVVGFDISAQAMEEFEEHGGRGVGSNAAVAAESDVVLTALNYPEIVEEVFFGSEGIVEGAEEELVCIEQSTVPPDSTRNIAAKLEGTDIDLLGAPFQGNPYNCRNGSLVLPIGGRREVYEDERVQAVLGAQTRAINYMGDIGAGKATKLVSQCMGLGNTALALEALALGAAQGLEPGRLHEALKWGGATSLAFRLFVPTALNRDFEPTFSVEYTLKDLRFALQAAEDADFPLSIGSTILQEYTAAAAMGYQDEATPAVVKVFEEYLDGTLEAEGGVEVSENDPIFSK